MLVERALVSANHSRRQVVCEVESSQMNRFFFVFSVFFSFVNFYIFMQFFTNSKFSARFEHEFEIQSHALVWWIHHK
jgi:hypothetical protein